MKLCPKCEYENFNDEDVCERCGNSIKYCKKQFFHFDDFILKNSQLYIVLGVFIALAKYFNDSKNENSFLIVFILLILSIYLLALIILKAHKYLKYSQDDNIFNPQAFFGPYIFIILHSFLFLGIILIVFIQYFVYSSVSLAFLITLEYLSQQKRENLLKKVEYVLYFCLLIPETLFFFSLRLDKIINFINNPLSSNILIFILLSLLISSYGIITAYILVTFWIFIAEKKSGKKFYPLDTHTVRDYQLELIRGITILLLIIILTLLFK